MQNDEGDRPNRQPSEPDQDAEQRPADEPLAPTDADEATRSPEPPAPEPEPPAAEPEASAPEPSWPTEVPASEPTSAEAWPMEPPVADSGAADTWLTRSPERTEAEPTAAGQEEMEAPVAPAWETTPTEASAPGYEAEHEPPPSEVEAYPGGGPPVEEVAPVAAAAHTVPASGATFGESTLCPRCGTENRAGLAFCRNCGQRLVAAGAVPTVERPTAPEGTQACPRCGTHNRAGVAFCQNCGANLRAAATGYVPPAVGAAPAEAAAERRGGAALGPIVLIVGIVGIVTAYLLPFAYGTNSLYERALASGGYGIAFWNGYADVTGGLADQAYFGLAAPSPLVALILLLLAFAGFVRGAPGAIQRLGILIALLWSIATAALFVVVEVLGAWEGDVVGLLRDLSPAGIIFFLASLIVLIGTLTRLARS